MESLHNYVDVEFLDQEKQLSMRNSTPLSNLKVLILRLNCVVTRLKKNWMNYLVWDLWFIRWTQVYLLKSSIMVRKNCEPLVYFVEKGPHISTWTISKGNFEVLLLIGNDKHFCFAKGKILQILLESTEMEGTKLCSKLILESAS